jgi:transposase
MHQSLRPYSLVPSGFVVESAIHDADTTRITVRGSKDSGICPSCGTISGRVHSRYQRRVSDLPLSGRSVQLVVVARRFRCDAVLCGRQIFVERFAGDVLAPSARRTGRLDCIVHHLGLALGGRPAANFARRLMVPVSNDTLLRVVRRRTRLPFEPLNVIGIDDWAWRRNHRYGTIVCDLERRRPVTLLPDREPATAAAWLERHQQITVVARDRGGGYGEAVARALPHATQVADRWHLMENASRAFLDAVRKTMHQIRTTIGATTINPDLLTAAERLQYEGYQRREEINAAILALAKDGVPIKQIVRRLGHSRKLVRQVIRGERHDIFRTRQSSLDRHLPWLDAQWSSGVPQRLRPLAAPQRAGVPWFAQSRQRMGYSAAPCGKGRCPKSAADPVSAHYRSIDDDRAEQSVEVRDGHHCGDRERGPVPRGGSRDNWRIPQHGPRQSSRRARGLDRESPRKHGRFFC